MLFQKSATISDMSALQTKPLTGSAKVPDNILFDEQLRPTAVVANLNIDLKEIYFLILHFLSAGPCERTVGQLWKELLEHQLLPRRYHAWYSRSGSRSGDSADDGVSFPLSYESLVNRYSHIGKDHLVKLLKQLMLNAASPSLPIRSSPTAVDVPTLLGTGSFSLLSCEKNEEKNAARHFPYYLRWPHMEADQVHALALRAIGGGFTRHHRAPSIRAACYAIAKPSTMVQKMQNIKKMRGHRNAVYCAIFDRSGRYVITGSDDRLVKIWSMETAFCLASCRGHEGDITDLAVSSNNALVASASNDFVIRVWRLPDGLPISILQGHTGAVTAIAFSPRASCVYQLLSSSDDGTCRIWDARHSQFKPRIYIPKSTDSLTGRNSVYSSSGSQQNHQILCCAYNANGTAFVTGSSDNMARVWSACKSGADDSEQPHHEIDVLAGHENDVNYVQFGGCAVSSRSTVCDVMKEEQALKFKNLWFSHDNIVTCSRDGSAIIWIPRSRRSHGKVGRWMKAYHLKVPPPPLPPQPPRGGPRRRILPTPRGVNMIVWSLDNRFVLAAIMDCRICVWNAADGSLVHSLTGHKESTYVLDVHPFNPRIAMSAGYDGQTIIWDIWEGSPVKTFEIGRFKLVDGKFSPDGTSIVLSDDVGQIYLLNTGQGESYKDAKYDQFFLGDYRPLIRDAVGNALDQETQLPPHRRNMQDQLCDSSLIPYPEPYQTMYQRRRLGTLGMEWRPSSIKFAVGPDFSLSDDYPMMPLEDLDAAFIMPEPVDAALWEPEVEVIDNDTDSEYNVAEEESSEKEPESLSDSSFSDPGSSGAEQRRRDRICRSKRKNDRVEVEFTASGRRVKKRNLGEHGGASSRNIRKKVINGKKVSRKRSFKAKILRPQRNAAQNAMNMLSQISETSSNEEFDDSKSDSSDNALFSQHSILQNMERDKRQHNRLYPNERTLLDGCSDALEPVEDPESQSNVGNRKRLVLKFSVRDSKRTLLSGSPMHKCDSNVELDSSNSLPQQERENYAGLSVEDPAPSANASDAKPSKGINRIKIRCKGVIGKNVGDSNMSLDTMKDNGLGEFRVQSSMQLASGDLLHDAGQSYASPTAEDRDSNYFDRSAGIKGSDMFNDGFLQNDVVCSNNCSRGSKENATQSKLKLKSSEYKTPKLMLCTGVTDPVAAEDYSAQKDVAGYGVSEEDSSFDSECSDYDFPQAEADAIRRARSLELKATPRQLTIGGSKLMLKKGNRSVGTSKAVEGSHIESRSNKSKRETVHDAPNSLTVSQPSFLGGKIPWLMLSEHEPGYRYIPQLGDEVVYLRQGHQEYIESSCSDERGPWVSMKGELGAVEFCQVEGLVYAALPGSGESCCKITLRIIDPSNGLSVRKFKLTLPELVNFPDFVVERSRFEAAMLRNWAPRDRCLVWWRNENGEGGSWWEGRIFSEKPKSSDFPDSPWERFVIQYKGDPDEHLHSPWELHDLDDRWVHPHIDYQIRNELLACFNEVEQSTSRNKDSFGVKKLKQVSQKSDFLNRYPVPLSPDIIQSRLEHNYYRNLKAVKHDFEVMMKIAEDYFAKNRDLLAKVRRLSEYFKERALDLLDVERERDFVCF